MLIINDFPRVDTYNLSFFSVPREILRLRVSALKTARKDP